MAETQKENDKNHMCYCLQDESGKTYIGYSVDVDRRLRQHNGELKGGARATSRGSGWVRVCHVTGFPDKVEALRFEWAWKAESRKVQGATPILRRLNALIELCNKDKSTRSANQYDSYEGPLCIFVDDERYKNCLAKATMAHALVIE